ncbi:MAG TPA: hypothetical protein VNB94_11895 [Mycobacteriales bacterium]|nr:hypothetical protein [Mycobacteriales bacterium]
MAVSEEQRSPGRALAFFAVAVIIGHHIGTLAKPLGTVGPTEWADWIDLLVPLAVLGTAAWVLATTRALLPEWLLFAVGAMTYAQGHGLHLGANSVSNAGPTGRARDAAHLWDEVVSHYIWYAGLAVVVFALARALARGGALAQVGPAGYLLAGLFGLTWTTNAIEGGTVALSAAAAVGFVGFAMKTRGASVSRALLSAYGLSLVLLTVWGGWHRGFPQFSELGWI